MFQIRGLRPVIVALAISPLWAMAQSYQEIEIKSKFDSFKLTRSGGKYTLEGEPVQLGQLTELMPLFSSELEGDCSGFGKADLTIRVRSGDKWITRNFNVAKKLVQADNQCVPASGDGIFFAPLHRSWFSANDQRKIALRSPLKILKGDETIMAVEMHDGEWRNSNPQEFLNWQFFEEFTGAIQEFSATHHAHKALAKDKLQFTLVSGSRKINFYRVTGTMWMAEIPGLGWLVSGSTWPNWHEMDHSQWVDRFSSQLMFALDKGKGADERRGTLGTLASQWSPSIREALRTIVLDRDEDSRVQLEAVRLLRQKPSNDNTRILIRALSKLENPEVLESITRALLVRNPKGQVLEPSLSGNERARVKSEWMKWWKEVSAQ